VSFHVGDKLIHSAYGLGNIVEIEEKMVQDQATTCYVFRTNDLTIWIPINDLQKHSLRQPTPPAEFEKLAAILSGPGEPLPDDRILRKEYLGAEIRDGRLDSICKVIRDLTHLKRTAKLNDQERATLERAMKSLMTEWVYSMGVTPIEAQREIAKLLGE
jgi:RNA polymerase-interacting CarD/CdnL/TRCF family regulator